MIESESQAGYAAKNVIVENLTDYYSYRVNHFSRVGKIFNVLLKCDNDDGNNNVNLCGCCCID